jgi:hypothetical protein
MARVIGCCNNCAHNTSKYMELVACPKFYKKCNDSCSDYLVTSARPLIKTMTDSGIAKEFV